MTETLLQFAGMVAGLLLMTTAAQWVHRKSRTSQSRTIQFLETVRRYAADEG